MKPNILFILADDLGYADLSCYGRRDFSTPNIDRIAADGMRHLDPAPAEDAAWREHDDRTLTFALQGEMLEDRRFSDPGPAPDFEETGRLECLMTCLHDVGPAQSDAANLVPDVSERLR